MLGSCLKHGCYAQWWLLDQEVEPEITAEWWQQSWFSSGADWAQQWRSGSQRGLPVGGKPHAMLCMHSPHTATAVCKARRPIQVYAVQGIAQDQDRHSFTKHHSGEFMPDEPSIFAVCAVCSSACQASSWQCCALRQRAAASSP